MYAKMLMPGLPAAVPYLTVTTSSGEVLMPQLLDRGWGPFDGPIAPAPVGRVVIIHQRLQVIVEGEVAARGP